MSPRSKRRRRGATLVETLAVLVILGLLTDIVVTVIAPILRAPANQQAKVDTLQAVTRTMYRLQRDMRLSDAYGDFACDDNGTASCSQPATLTSKPIVALVTPLTSGSVTLDGLTAQIKLNGYQVYQVTSDNRLLLYYGNCPNISGPLAQALTTENSLQSTLGGIGALNGVLGLVQTTLSSTVKALIKSTAESCVNAALNTTPQLVSPYVSDVSISVNTDTHIIGVKVTAQATESTATNELNYEGDTYARN